jgi:hypothetical protein
VNRLLYDTRKTNWREIIMKRKVKSVSFNLSDPFEQEMYEYTKRFSNFSTFVKRLIQNSLQSKNEQVKNAE